LLGPQSLATYGKQVPAPGLPQTPAHGAPAASARQHAGAAHWLLAEQHPAQTPAPPLAMTHVCWNGDWQQSASCAHAPFSPAHARHLLVVTSQ
jgi:hypothetical protein